MEQTTQQISQKPPLPIKTKIAAGLLIFAGIFGIIQLLIWFFIFIILGIFLLMKKRWAWWFSIVYTLISTILMLDLLYEKGRPEYGYSEGMGYYLRRAPQSASPYEIVAILIPLIAFILLLLDRKNYFKITPPFYSKIFPFQKKEIVAWLLILLGGIIGSFGLWIYSGTFWRGVEWFLPVMISFIPIVVGAIISFFGLLLLKIFKKRKR